MGWVRIDDGFFSHRKILEVSPPARLLFLAGLAYAAGQLTDGFLSLAPAKALAGQQGIPLGKASKELVEVGLWHKHGDGWEIHDYLEYQPSAESERGRRDRVSAARADAGRLGGVRSGASRRSKPGSKTRSKTGTNGEANEEANTQANRSPDPIEPKSLSSFSDLRPPPVTVAETEDAGSSDPVQLLTGRMIGFLARPSPKATAECRHVAIWALEHLDPRFADEFVGYVGTLNGKPRSAAYFATAIRDLASQRGVDMPEFRPLGGR